jgi:lectin, mannose-binding 2
MPNAAYLGFSAETGELSDNFDIISVETRNMYSPAGSSGPRKTDSMGRGGRGRREKQKGSGWGWFFTKIFLFVLAAGGSYVGYTMYRANKRSVRF